MGPKQPLMAPLLLRNDYLRHFLNHPQKGCWNVHYPIIDSKRTTIELFEWGRMATIRPVFIGLVVYPFVQLPIYCMSDFDTQTIFFNNN